MKLHKKIKKISLSQTLLFLSLFSSFIIVSIRELIRKLKSRIKSLGFRELFAFRILGPSFLRGFGLRGLFLEISLLLAASLGITLSARLLLFAYLESSTLTGQKDLLISYIFFQDLFSLTLVICGAFLIGLLFRSYPRLRFSLWTFYLFLVGLSYLVNLKYYSLYAENFSWSHLKKSEVLNIELWHSLGAELDHELGLQLLVLALFCLLWFFISLRVVLRVSPFLFDKEKAKDKNKTKFFSKQALARFCLFFLSLLFLFSTANLGLAEVSLATASQKNHLESAHFLQRKARLSNFLWQLSFPEQGKLQSESYKLLPLHDSYRFRPFQFGFDSSSKEDPSPRKPIPFLRKGNYNIVLYILESTAYSYLKKKLKGEIPITPGWQRLSQNAIVFENHYVHNPLSANSLFSLLVSAYSMPADIWPVRDYPQIPLQSLPQVLKGAGYRNAFLHTGHLSYVGQDKFLANRGFDLLQDMRHLRRAPYEKALNWGIDDRALIAAARKFAESSSQPYFLVLSPLSPHHPYDVPEEKFQLLKPPPEESQTSIPALSTLEKNWQPQPKKNSFRRYLNSLHYADSVLQELVHSLENLPGGENTLFFIVADHGEAFGQHKGNFNHPFYLYEENVHVPFLIYNAKLFASSFSYKGHKPPYRYFAYDIGLPGAENRNAP